MVIAESLRHFSIFTAVDVVESKVLINLRSVNARFEIEEKRG